LDSNSGAMFCEYAKQASWCLDKFF
jgi:hypothetical protein